MGHFDAFHVIVALVDALLSPELVAIDCLGEVDDVFPRLALAFGERDSVRWPQQLPLLSSDALLIIRPLADAAPGISVLLKGRVFEEGTASVGKRQGKLA